MLFNSFQFLLFFPLVLIFYFALPKKAKNLWLLGASYFFYMNWNAKYGLLLLSFTLITYLASIVIEKTRKVNKNENAQKKILLIFVCSIFIILSVLFYFKYFNFFLQTVSKFFKFLHIQLSFKKYDIVLPVGISFFAFQAIGYLADVMRGDTKAEKNFFRYALFVSFFPQLVAGPIERSKTLLRQLEKTYSFDFERAKDGIFSIIWGFFLKLVVADRASVAVDFIFSNENSTGLQVISATFLFAFQIYCDFCGYSTIALGASKILGINLMRNFNSPYFSVGISDFWRRWHISLSSWFRDYIYIPLGGNRCSALRRNMNIMAVMLVSGIWHGAGVNYILWGGLHGALQIAENFFQPALGKINKYVRMFLTFMLVCAGWFLFRCVYISRGIKMIKSVIRNFSPKNIFLNSTELYNLDAANLTLLLISILIVLFVDFIYYKGFSIKEFFLRQKLIVQSALIVFFADIVIIFGIWGTSFNKSAFIYFQF